MSAAQVEGAARVLALYRRLLRLHRARLAPPLRSLGDAYMKAEFSRHLKGRSVTSAQWAEFAGQWQAYASALEGRADADEAAGDVAPLHDAGAAPLTAEQQAQLQRLREAALELGGGGSSGGDATGGGGSGDASGSGGSGGQRR